MEKLIIKFTPLKDGNIEVTYSDNTKEVITQKQFNQYTKNNNIKMAMIIPK